MTTVLFLNDTRDHGNWGSKANADAFLKILRDTLPEINIESIMSLWTTRRFRQLPKYLGNTIFWKPKRFIQRFSKHFEFLPIVADDFEIVAEDWLRGRGGPFVDEYLGKLKKSDLVIFNAEGSTYRNNTSAIRCLFALWLARTHFDKPAFFMNGSVTLTVVDPILPAMVRKTFATLSGVTVREPCSLRNVDTFAPGISVELVPDSVFYLTKDIVEKVNGNIESITSALSHKPYFCLSLSMLLSLVSGYGRHGIRKTALFALIKELQKITPHAVILARDEMDMQICRELANTTGSLFFGPEYTYEELFALFQNARFLISGRYHHLILATIAGCPSIALKTTSHKVDGLCELLGGEIGTAFDATELWDHIDSISQIGTEYREIFPQKREKLQDIAADFCHRSTRLGQIVKTTLEEYKS